MILAVAFIGSLHTIRQVLLLGLVVAASAGKSTFGFYDEKRHG